MDILLSDEHFTAFANEIATLYYGANYFLLKFTQETSSLIKHPVVFDGKVISMFLTRTSWKLLCTN